MYQLNTLLKLAMLKKSLKGQNTNMKSIKSLLLLALGLALFTGVTGAGVNVPASTDVHEKQATADGWQPEIFHGANDLTVHIIHYLDDCSFTMGMLSQPIYTVDESYYNFGYKAKLSDAAVEIFAPPQHSKSTVYGAFKLCRRYSIIDSKRRLCGEEVWM